MSVNATSRWGVELLTINDEQDLQTIRQMNRLFYDNCQPNLQQAQENGDRHAVVFDNAQDALIVVCQKYPYYRSPIIVTALVVSDLVGLTQCILFLRYVLRETYPWATGIRVHHNVIIHITSSKITIRDIHDTFVRHGFMAQ
jgi:hypothetical protein